MRFLIAFATAGLLAGSAAAAQTTTTVVTREGPARHSTTVRHVETRHVEMRNAPRTRAKRVCTTRIRNHHRVRTCRVTRVRY